MPNNVNTAPSLPNGRSHEHATDAPDRRRPPSSPTSPSLHLLSLLDVDQLRQECHITRSNVTKHELVPQQRVELVHAVPWRTSEEAEYSTVFSWSSTSRKSAPADPRTFRSANTLSLHTLHIRDTLGHDQFLMEESHGNHGIPTLESPINHPESVYVTLEIDKTLTLPACIAVGRLEITPDSFRFSDPNELALSIPYPTMILEDAPSLRCCNIHATCISPMPGWQN